MRRSLALAAWLALALACRGGEKEEAAEPAPVPVDSLTAEEQARFRVDPSRYPEMQDGRLDTVDMKGEGDGGTWQVQAVNYTADFIAMTYAFWYSGPDSVASFAADRQPRLVDNRGHVYEGVLVPDNPRLRLERQTTGVGVFVFTPGVVEGADSLTLYVNDSTPPAFKVGPWGVYHTPPDTTGRIRVRPGD